MKLPVQIIFRDLVPLPSLEPEIRRRADQLDQWSPDLMSCHVVVESEANRHRQGHRYRVKVNLRLPDGELMSGDRQGNEDIYLALRESFDALDRQVEDHARRHRGQVKQHAEVLHGRIASLSEDGSGRILSAAGETYHFDRSHVLHPDFDRLAVDQEVRFLEGVTRAGREARRVCAAAPTNHLPE